MKLIRFRIGYRRVLGVGWSDLHPSMRVQMCPSRIKMRLWVIQNPQLIYHYPSETLENVASHDT